MADIPPPSAPTFDAFLSYSRHDPEARLLKAALERFARPWYRPRSARIYLDTAAASAGGPLRAALERSLESSGALVLLASPASADSHWVNEEVRWWVEHHGTARIVIACVDARPAGGGSAVRPPVPQVLADAIGPDEHLWVDLRWMREGGASPDRRDPRMTDAAAQILAALRGVPKDDLVGEHVRRRRQTRRLVTGTVGTLSVLLLAAVVLAVLAVAQRNTAVEERMAATSRQLVAQSQSIEEEQPGLARQLLVQAYRFHASEQAIGALIRSPRLAQEMTIDDVEPAVAVSPAAPVLATVEDGHVVVRWLASGRRLAGGPPATPDAHLAFSADGTTLALANAGSLSLWRLGPDGSLEELGAAPLPGDGGRVVVRAADSVVLVEGDEDLTFVDVADPSAPSVITTVPNPSFGDRLRVIDSGALLASPATPIPDGVPVPVVVTPLVEQLDTAASILGAAVAQSPDGVLLASGAGEDLVTVWDVADPAKPVVRAELVGESLGISSVAFSGDGTALAVGTGAGIVQLWDLDDPVRPVLRERLRTRPESVDQLAFGAGSTALVAVTGDATSEDETGLAQRRVARVWPVQQASRTVSSVRIEGGRTARPSWDPMSTRLIGGFPTRIWDVVAEGAPVPLGLLPSFAVGGGSAFAFTPDGTGASTGWPAVRWDVTDPTEPVRTTTDVVIEDPAELAIHDDDGDLLVLGTAFGTLDLWDTTVEAPQLASDLPGSRSGTQAAAFVAGRELLVTLAEEGGALVWDVGRDRPSVIGTIPGDVASVAGDTGDTTVVVGGARGDVSVWDLSDPRSPQRVMQRSAHVGAVTGVAARRGADTIATAGEDGVRLWSRTDRGLTLMATLRAGRPFDAPALAFSPDGAFLAASSSDGTDIWDVDVDRLLGGLCRDSEAVTFEQWQEYLPDVPYDPPCDDGTANGQVRGP